VFIIRIKQKNLKKLNTNERETDEKEPKKVKASCRCQKGCKTKRCLCKKVGQLCVGCDCKGCQNK